MNANDPQFWMMISSIVTAICFIVMVHIAQQQTRAGLVHDQSDIAANPDRRKVFILGLVQFVKLHPGIGRIHLQIECGGFDGLLLFAG